MLTYADKNSSLVQTIEAFVCDLTATPARPTGWEPLIYNHSVMVKAALCPIDGLKLLRPVPPLHGPRTRLLTVQSFFKSIPLIFYLLCIHKTQCILKPYK